MTKFHKWDDVKHEIFDEEDLEAIEQGAARRLAAIRLADLRRRSNLTQRQVAQRMGVRQERVSAIERGGLDALQLSTLIAYAEAIGGRVNLLVEVEGEELKVV
jgi:predicted XRE-type DNA-binding protein